jgi:hypothetical protein
MNRDYILFHLREAQEAITKMIEEIESTPDYGYGEFVVETRHLYHHINTAWNARDASPERAHECTEEDFASWRLFPGDLDMSV